MNNQKTEKHWLILNMIQGHIAMWAVRQSPYHAPDGLLEVLKQFAESVRAKFDSNEMANMDRAEVREMLKSHLLTIPQVLLWNERKNGRQGMGICSRYDKPTPDDDFIDLDALIRNIEVELFRELERDKAFCDKFDREQKWGAPKRWLGWLRYKLSPCKPCIPTSPTNEN